MYKNKIKNEKTLLNNYKKNVNIKHTMNIIP